MALVARKLGNKNLPESERSRLNWIKQSTKDADHKLAQLVEVGEGGNKESRLEGFPMEGLLAEVGREVKKFKPANSPN